jgi:hypothetical protein
MPNPRFWPFVSLLLVVLAGCLTKEVPDDASGVDAGAADADTMDARGKAPKLPPPTRKDLGQSCAGAAECASGFCVDGVCCDAACGAECFACNVSGSAGRCTALDGVEDSSTTSSCAGTSVCAKDSSGATACRSKDGEACTHASDCASGYCRTYYRDADSDGYGASSADDIVRCDATTWPPQGFSTNAGDCCDTDPGANPGTSSYFTTRDRCGSFDWNCSGADDKQSSVSCPTSGASLGCGQACSISFKGSTSVLFTQACR